jgi:hypothetical protein
MWTSWTNVAHNASSSAKNDDDAAAADAEAETDADGEDDNDAWDCGNDGTEADKDARTDDQYRRSLAPTRENVFANGMTKMYDSKQEASNTMIAYDSSLGNAWFVCL